MIFGGEKRTGAIAAVVSAIVVGAPVLAVLASLTGPYGDTIAHVAATVGADYLVNTAILCFAVGAASAILGGGAAFLAAVCDFPLRRFFALALIFPLATPAYIAAYAYADLLGPFGALAPLAGFAQSVGLPPIKSLAGAAFVLSLTLFPYVYLTARAAFAAQSSAMLETARTLGARPLKAALVLLAPMARPAIAGGAALAMMETAAEFGVADYFGVSTLSVGVFRTWHSFGDLTAASQVASALFIFSLSLVAFESITRRGRTSEAPRVSRAPMRIRLNGFAAAGAVLFCAILVCGGFFVPAIAIAAKLDPSLWPVASRNLGATAANSFSIAAAGVVSAIALSLLLAYAGRQTANSALKALIRIATLGYAVPGTVIAIGVLATFSTLRETIGPAAFLGGGAAALIYAYSVRFLTAGYNAASAGLDKIDKGYDAAAKTLGAGASRILATIHAPLLRRAVFAGATIVFVDIIKELPATLILRDFNFETLATRVYRLAGDERLAEAAPEALILIGVGAIPILIFHVLSEMRGSSIAK